MLAVAIILRLGRLTSHSLFRFCKGLASSHSPGCFTTIHSALHHFTTHGWLSPRCFSSHPANVLVIYALFYEPPAALPRSTIPLASMFSCSRYSFESWSWMMTMTWPWPRVRTVYSRLGRSCSCLRMSFSRMRYVCVRSDILVRVRVRGGGGGLLAP